jgi:nickel/cobalt transporter (NicO) family protein
MHQALFYMVSSFWAGVVHAATPGHGKTIAAAYIVGARGRPVDAVILGVFVTLSHVSGIVLVGVLASIGSSWLVPARTEVILALSMAVLVLALGLWMLWTQRDLIALAFPRRRTLHSHDDDHTHRHPHDVLASSVGHLHQNDHGHTHDHDNVPGHGHAHEHDDAHGRAGDHRHAQDGSHTHDHGHTHEHDDVHALDTEGEVWHSHGWGTRHAHRLDLVTGQRPKLAVLMTLSIAGGILPDPAALAILLAALSTGRVVLGLVTVLVFSLGFAAALVVVGVVAAQVGRRVLSWLDSMWALRLQLATTLLIIGMGCWLTARAIGQFAPAMSL